MGGLFRRFSKSGSTDVANVNGYVVGVREFQRKVGEEQRRESYMRQQFGSNAALFLEALGLGGKPEDRALKALISQKLLLGVADKVGLVLSPRYVSQKLEDPNFAIQVMGDLIPGAAVTSKGINYRDLLKLLQRQGIPASCLEEIVEERIKGQVVADLAQGAAYVPEETVKEDFNRAYQGKKLLIIKIPIESYLKRAREVKIPEQEYLDALKKSYQEANQRSRRYWSPEKRTGEVWTFNHVPEEFLPEAERALRVDKKATEIDELAKKYHGTKSPLGPTASKQDSLAQDTLTRKLFELKLDGDVADSRTVFVEDAKGSSMQKPDSPDSHAKDQRGFIIQLTKIEPSTERPFEYVKADVEKDYYLSQAAQMLGQDLVHLKNLKAGERPAWIKEHGATEAITGFLAPDKRETWRDLQKAGGIAEGIKSEELSPLLSMSDVGEKKTILTPQAGYLVEINELEPFDSKKFEEKRPQLFNTLMGKESGRVVQGFIASLEKNATIKTNKSFFSHR